MEPLSDFIFSQESIFVQINFIFYKLRQFGFGVFWWKSFEFGVVIP